VAQDFNNFCKVCDHLIDEGYHCDSCAKSLKRWELFDDLEIREIRDALTDKANILKPYINEEELYYHFKTLIDQLNEIQRLKEVKEASGKILDLSDDDLPF
jgi:hypothetical protein